MPHINIYRIWVLTIDLKYVKIKLIVKIAKFAVTNDFLITKCAKSGKNHLQKKKNFII